MCSWVASGLFDQLEAHGVMQGQLIRGRSARVTLEWVKTVPPRPDLRDALPEPSA